MYLITNRALNTKDKKKGLNIFAKTPNPEGPNELRLMQVSRKNNTWVSKEVKDKLTLAAVKALKKKHGLDIDILEAFRWHANFLPRPVSKTSRYYFLSTVITMTSRT